MGMWMWIFAIFFAILNGVIANNKNRNVAGWAFSGFLFGIFAFAILLFMKPIDGGKSE